MTNAAELLGISRSTLWRRVRQHGLSVERVGRHAFVRLFDLVPISLKKEARLYARSGTDRKYSAANRELRFLWRMCFM